MKLQTGVPLGDPAAEMHRMFASYAADRPKPCPAIARLYYGLLDAAKRADQQGDADAAARIRRQAASLLKCDQPTPCVG